MGMNLHFVVEEPAIKKTLNHILKNKKLVQSIFTTIYKVNQYYDEPQYWSYSGIINNNLPHEGLPFQATSSGFSLNDKIDALAKCLFEGIERLSNHIYRRMFIDYIGSIKSLKRNFIDPTKISKFSEKQLNNPLFKKFIINDKSRFNWTTCYSLFNEKPFLVPCSLVYLSYKFMENEPYIYPTISTGVAGGATLASAIKRGIFEILERDAYIIHYLNKVPGRKIRLTKIKNFSIQRYVQLARRYKFSISIIDISTDIAIPIIAAVIIDKTKIGKAVSVGLKCDFDPIRAIIGAIDEAFHTRGRFRIDYEQNHDIISIKNLLMNSNIQNRGKYWFPNNMIGKVDFWTKSDLISPLENKMIHNTVNDMSMDDMIALMKKKRYGIYYKNITLPELNKLNYFIVKVIMPDFQPLYLDENYKTFGGRRLYAIPNLYGKFTKGENELNSIPHPFL